MSLQSRLFAFFIVIVVTPLTIAPLIGQRILVSELERRTFEQIKAAQSAEMKVFDEKRSRAYERVAAVAGDPALVAALRARRSAEADQVLAGYRQEINDALSFIVVTDTSDKVIASSVTEPSFERAVKATVLADLARPSAPDQRLLFYRDEAYITGPGPVPDSTVTIGKVYGGFYYDRRFLSSLSTQTSVGTTLFVGGRAVASTSRTVKTSKVPVTITPLLYSSEGKRLSMKIAGVPSYAIARPLNHGVRISDASFVFTRSQSSVIAVKRTLQRSLFGLLGAAILIAGTLGWALARVISRPLRELAAGANQIAVGNYDQEIRVRARDEMGQLAASFNGMAKTLSAHIADLHESREELKRAYTRFGTALRATHDLENLLELVLDTSIDTLSARRGALMLLGPRGSLRIAVSRGMDEGFDLEVGKSVAGYVVKSGEALRYPAVGESEGKVQPPAGSGYDSMLAAPLYSESRIIGVLNLYERDDSSPYGETDLATLVSLADQAGVAVENVLLHREAQRLAIMDGLTGIWNHRYFQMQFDQEIDRAARFGHPFALVILDIDDFKEVNDTYGHQFGNTVLIELASRVKSVIRDIDRFARYGGEEFVLILPETNAQGAVLTAERVRAAIASKPFQGETVVATVDVSVSVGIACYPENGFDKATLTRAADSAMYQAKTKGKDRVVLFEGGTPAMPQSAAE